MGHLPIVYQSTVREAIQDGYISTRGDLKEQWEKTTADIFSDALATRPGDPVFPWIVAGEGDDNLGFKYVFTIGGPPIFVQGDKYPVKIPLSQEGLEFPEPLPEAAALDLWSSRLLWNAIGKKSLRRGRSLTHQTPMEDGRLLALLNSLNPDGPRKIALGREQYSGVRVTIDPSQTHWDEGLARRLKSLSPDDRLSALDLSGIPWRRDEGFVCEKALEAWVMENIDKGPGVDLRESILGTDSEIEWFGNYLPFGVAGGNIDVVVIQRTGSGDLAHVIELKVGSLRKTEFTTVAGQVSRYCEFIESAFRAYGERVEARGVVISGPGSGRGRDADSPLDAAVRWFNYSIADDGSVHLTAIQQSR